MTTERKRLQAELAAQGFVVRVNEWPKKATYYKADGEAMPNLPADPGSMARYMARGLTLVKPLPPPAGPVVVAGPVAMPEAEPIGVQRDPLVCGCGFIARTAAGLKVHQGKHTKERA